MSAFFNDEDLVRIAHEIVSIPSLSGDEERAALRFVERLSERGFDAHIDEAGNAVGVLGDGPKTIALVGHIDTVPGQPEVRIDGGVLHGRGSVDAKGPLVTLAAAARRAVDAGAEARFVVVGCVEEEVASSKGAHHLAASWPLPPDALVIGEPSAAHGVTLGYKGYLKALVRVQTPSAHGAHEAPSAPELATELWCELRDRARAFRPSDAALFDLVMPRLLSIQSSHDGLTEQAQIALAL
ncbi:MAG: M20/M25/M40 family metallo-hydrolase, partial [Planctomycetota bacterium]